MTSEGTDTTDAPSDDGRFALRVRGGWPEGWSLPVDNLPRSAWPTHPNFAGLTAYWLERHALFRELISRIGGDCDGVATGALEPATFGHRLARLGGMLLNQLHSHHQVEDEHYFPLLVQREPALARGFEILERDHLVIADWLAQFAERSNTLLATLASPTFKTADAEAYRDWLVAFTPLLDRHLSDEEDLVIPLLLRDGEG